MRPFAPLRSRRVRVCVARGSIAYSAVTHPAPLLSRQRVPFAFSTSDPVLDDFRQYPRIREYLVNNFSEVDGYDGRLLVNTTLQPVRGFGPMSLRCFQ